MLVVYTLLAALLLIAIAIAGLAIRIIIIKDGRFPDTHVGHNKEMRKRGLVCAKTFDKLEQKNSRKPVDYATLRLDKNV